MTQTPQTHRPSDQILLRVQKEEIDRINDNRVYLLALNEEIRTEALNEVANRDRHIESLQEQIRSLTEQVAALSAQPQDEPSDEVDLSA